MYTNYLQTDWLTKLVEAKFALNNCQSSATGHSPFFLLYGQHPYMGKEPQSDPQSTDVQEYLSNITTIRNKAHDMLKASIEKMKKYYDQNKKQPHNLSIGQSVLLNLSHFPTARPS